MSRLSYEKRLAAVVNGKDAKTIASNNQKQLESAIESQISIKKGYRLDKELAVESAKESVENSLLYGGQSIASASDREKVLTDYFNAKVQLEKAETDLKNHELEVQWLEEARELIK